MHLRSLIISLMRYEEDGSEGLGKIIMKKILMH